MMLKTVYGLPPADSERIEAAEEEADSALVRGGGCTGGSGTVSRR